ncbi:XRE family transcriptional regulator [bacterium]|nr:MAG: XRE family transcriptional regulator [bacterium]
MAKGNKKAPAEDDARPTAPRRRLPGVALKPGTVKQARLEAGLSLAKVGKGHVTAPAIYLIETGRTRPSMPTLEHIAQRTGKPVEFFLADPASSADESRAAHAELEAMVGAGRYAEAVVLGKRLLNLGPSAYRPGRIRYYLAQAYLQLAQPDEAVALLAEARAHFIAVNDEVMLAECLGSEAALASFMQRPDALSLAEQALAVCRRLKPVPRLMEARLLGIQATAHVANREWDRAIETYQAAIGAAGPLFDLRRVAKMYAELGSTYREQGQVDLAARYATRSMALLDVLRDRVALARSENNLGLILAARGDAAAAKQHLDKSKELSPESELEVGRSHVLLALCELCLQQGRVQQAHELAEQALGLAERLQEGLSVAEAHVWLGRIAHQLGRTETVDREFELAIRGLEQLGARERLLQCHGIYAEILEGRGELASAYAHMKKALQASQPDLLQGQGPDAEERLNSA